MLRLLLLLILACVGSVGCDRRDTAGDSVEIAGLAIAPGFDCSRAEGSVERLICADEELSREDRRLAATWERVAAALPPGDPNQVRAEQRGWIKGRDDCWKAEDVKDCVLYAYRSRRAELDIRSGLVLPVAVTSYQCEGWDASVTIAWFRETDPPAAMISVGDDKAFAFQARAASGARYVAPGVEAWEHQGELALEWFGSKSICTV